MGRRRPALECGVTIGFERWTTTKEIEMAKDAPGMRGTRSRNQDGELRDKRDDTHIGTIEKKYGIDLHVRSDMQLGTYLEKNGFESLKDLLKSKR